MWWKKILFTALYIGYSPLAPGTMGTILAVLIYIIEYLLIGDCSWIINLFIVIIMLYPSIKLGDAGVAYFNNSDPQEIVLDEVMGFWISILFFPFNWKIIALAFVVFRIMDIIKPYPAYKLQRLKNGMGVMIDDYIAGIYSNITILIAIIIANYFNISFY